MKIVCQILLIAILVFSCSKEDEFYWGEVKALKNGQNWSGKIRAGTHTGFNNNRFSIVIDKYYDKYIIEEDLGFGNIPKKVGKYTLYKHNFQQPDSFKTTCSFYTFREDGDVMCDRYMVIDSDSLNNFIQIDSYNPANNEVKGRFAVSLLIEFPKCRPTAPDTIYFTNGEFHTKIK